MRAEKSPFARRCPRFGSGSDAAGNFAFWNPEAETELTVFVFMSAGTDTDTRTTHPALQPSRPETKLTHSTVNGLTNTRPPNNHDDAVNPDHGRNVVSSAPGQHYCVGWSDEASVHSIPDTISKTNPHGDALPAPPRALGMKECADAAG